MEIGCGIRVREIRGGRYLYFWHYDRENGASRRREIYICPIRKQAARATALRPYREYYRRAEAMARARADRIEAVLDRWAVTSTQR